MTILEILKQMLNITGTDQDAYLSSLISSTIDTLKTYYVNPLLTVYEYTFDNSIANWDGVVFKAFRVNFAVLDVKEIQSDGSMKDVSYTFVPLTMVLRFKEKPVGRVYIRFRRGYAIESNIPFLLKFAVAKLAYLEYYQTKYGGLVSSEQSVDGVRNMYKDFEEEKRKLINEVIMMMGGWYGV